MKEKILLAGGTGFIGYHLTKKLKKNYLITILSSHKVKANRKIKNIKYIICDVTFKNKLQKILKRKKFDHVINLSGYVNHSDKKKTFLSHYNGCKNLANIFLNKPIKSFIQFGSGLEYGRKKSPHKVSLNSSPNSNYAKAKYLSSKYLISLYRKKKFPAVILRLYQAYGPNQTKNRLIPIIIAKSLKNLKFDCTDGKQKRDFLYIDDLVQMTLKVIKSKKVKGKIINVGSGNRVSIKKIIEKIVRISKGGKPLYGKIKMRKDENINTFPDISNTKKLLQWKPNISLDTGLQKTINFYRWN